MASGVSRVIYRCEEAMETQQLDLSSCQLVHVAEAIYHLMRQTEIKTVSLRDNVITKISPRFPIKFNKLTQLDLSYNQIANLPNEIVDLKTLTCLNISFNSFVELPECIFRIPSLQELNASNNRITDIDVEVLSLAPALDSLDITNNPLSKKCHEDLERIEPKIVQIILSPREEEDWEDLNI